MLNQIRSLASEGRSASKIAKMLGTDWQTVVALCDANSIALPQQQSRTTEVKIRNYAIAWKHRVPGLSQCNFAPYMDHRETLGTVEAATTLAAKKKFLTDNPQYADIAVELEVWPTPLTAQDCVELMQVQNASRR